MYYPGSLHNHTQMSNFRGRDCIIKEKDLINRAIELNHSVVAITDHESISSAVNIEKLADSLPIKIIMGNEIYLCRDGLNADNFVAGADKYYHFILLAKDLEGFRQICQLSSLAWKRSYMAKGLRRVPTYYSDVVEIIGKNPGHVYGLTACLGGMLGTQLMKYQQTQSKELWDKILNWCTLMNNTFGGNFYLELQPSASEEQTYVNRKIIEISNTLNIPYVITTDSHYLRKEDREIHKAFLNAQAVEREVDSFYATTYLMDTQELESHLDLTREELDIAYQNILAIQNSCEKYSIRKPLKIPMLKWNEYKAEVTDEWIKKIPFLKTFAESSFVGDRELAKATITGILKHPDLQNEAAFKEINDNLRITWESSEVNKAHWSSYFLNLQKIIDLCWEAGSIVGPGRGSGVGFILLYCLDITQINPLAEETKTFSWRFLNPERVSVLDIDFDIEGSKREAVLTKFREFYGEDRVANVVTFRTEKTKSAILTAARGLGIDVDEAQYLASLIPADRGQLRTLKETFYGDEEKGFKPVTAFVNAMTHDYPELWAVAQKIEGLICGTGIHAGGVIFVDEPFENSTALMRAPDDTLCTQFELHAAEEVSLIKYDALSVEAMDKIHICLDLLTEAGLVEKKDTLRETYESVLNIYKIDRTSPEMWDMVCNHQIHSLFQMEQQSGIQGIALAKPRSVNDLCVLNSVIRLMAPDKDSDTPLVTWAKYRENINIWKSEMKNYGLNEEEIDWLSNHSAITDGICESQEGLMSLVQEERLGGNDLNFADRCRKGLAKKIGSLFQECEDTFYSQIKEKGCSERLGHYVWDVLLRVQRGYSFNRSHCLAYSLVAVQEMNLAYKFPTVFWNCACLISDSGGFDGDKSTDYGKIAVAVNKMQTAGIQVTIPNINTSKGTFVPDVKNNRIYYGLEAIGGINKQIVEKIIAGRPYTGIKDFMTRCPLDKTPMINLIKAGAFDEIEQFFPNRKSIMAYYIIQKSEPKVRLNLQNFPSLISNNLIPEDYIMYVRIFNFNKYLKQNKKDTWYVLDNVALEFFNKVYLDEADSLQVVEGETVILQKTWDKLYQMSMDPMRDYLKANQEEMLEKYNTVLFKNLWDKDCQGTYSKWEMNSLGFYNSGHELQDVDYHKYGIANFFDLSEESEVDYYFKRGGKNIPIYKIYKIAGTVLSKDDGHSSLTLLTKEGIVQVKMSKDQYSTFKKQVSQVQPDGTKKIIEKSWFGKGNMLMISGYRRENEFVMKTYTNTTSHSLYKIDSVVNGEISIRHEKKTGANTIEEEAYYD